MRIKKAFVTGATGALGSMTISQLLNKGADARALPLRDSNLQKLVSTISEFKPDVIFHTATIISSEDPHSQIQANLNLIFIISQAIGETAKQFRPMLVNFSSAAELGVVRPEGLPVKEDFLCQPLSGYGLSKLCQTQTALTLSMLYNFKCIVPRIFNILWMTQNNRQLLNQWIAQIFTQKKEDKIKLVTGRLDISRDFLNAEIIIETIIELAEKAVPNGIYNIASGKEVYLLSIVEQLSKISKKTICLEFDKKNDSKLQSDRIYADIGKTSRALNRSFSFDLEEEIKKAFSDSKSLQH